MATFTSKANGNWTTSGQTTWNEVGTPGSSDTVTISHAITISADITLTGLTFTMAAGSSLIGATAGGDVTVTLAGTTFTWHATGTSGSHCTILKTGSNLFKFASSAGTIVYDWAYVDATDVDNAAHTLSFPFAMTNQNANQAMAHCVFTRCGCVWGDTIGVDTASTGTTLLDYLSFPSAPGGEISLYWAGAGPYSGSTRRVTYSTFLKSNLYYLDGFTFSDCYFGVPLSALRDAVLMERCVVVENSNGESMASFADMTDVYLLCDHVDPSDRPNGTTNVGNPHVLVGGKAGVTYDGLIFEYPHAQQIDMGDGIYGSTTDAVIQHCLVLPSAKDGIAACSLLSITDASGTNQQLFHNTVVGTFCQTVFNEIDPTTGRVAEAKSNLACATSPSGVQGVGYPSGAGILTDLGPSVEIDLIPPAAALNNYLYHPILYTDGVTGFVTNGFRGHLSAIPDATNLLDTTTGPQFVDSTRNFGNWGIHKGATASGDLTDNAVRRVVYDDTRTYLAADPSLISDLIAWVRAGFVPQNEALRGAGHDGADIGAVAMAVVAADGTFGSIFAGGLR